jgi:probable phosphoglycerate mutase
MPHSQLTRIFAIRHGETAWNVDTRIQGQLDIPLNDTGRWQAARLAEALAGEELHAVYASDLSRAQATGAVLAQRLGLPIGLHPGLRERHFGIFQGHTHAEVEQRWPDAARRWRQRDPAFSPPEGERLADFYERCVATARELAQRHPGQAVALVAHGGVLDCLYRAATHQALNAPRSWSITNAGINRLLHGEQGFSLVGWGDTGHLEASGHEPAARDESTDGAVLSAGRDSAA